jgi:folate-binding protein YgfZ
MDKFLTEKFSGVIKAENKYLTFGDSKEELNVLRHGIGVRPVPDSAIIQLKGKDVLDFLHRVSTNSVLDLQPMHSRNTLFLNEKGRFIDKTNLLSLEEEFLLIGSSDNEKRLFSWINKFIIMEDIITQDLSEKFTLFELSGPQTQSFLTLMIGDEANSILYDSVRKFYIDGFMLYLFAAAGKNNLSSYKILIENEKTADFLNYLFENKSVFDLSLIGDYAYTAFRVKNKIPAFPNEINDSTNPHETDLTNEISFTKGCYIGQEVIARLETYDKIKRNFVTVELSDKINLSQTPAAVYSSTESVGMLTSVVNQELFDCKLGLALVNKKAIDLKEELFVTLNDKKISLKITQ